MSHVSLHLFGPPRLELDGVPVEIERRKALALLAYLAVTRQSHTRETLSALLWPETAPDRAYANLRQILWELNQTVGAGWVDANRDTVSLNLDADLWLDVAQFRLLLTTLGNSDQDCERCIPLLTEAVALYQDHFLIGFSLKEAPGFDEWLFFEAEGLRRDLAKSIETLVHCLCAQGQAQAAIPYGRRLVALDPVYEEAQRQLMEIYEQAGQHNAALHQYLECARVVRDELGTEPEHQTTALYEKLKAAGRQGKNLVRPIIPPRPHSNLPVQLTSFIGREEQIAELTLLLTPLHGGEGKTALPPSTQDKHRSQEVRLLTLTGSGGTGKTRLGLRVAADLLDVFPDGVWFVELAPLADPAFVPQTVTTALGLREEVGRPILDTLIDSLRAKTVLLILDNCEHLVEACAQLSETVLQTCPNVRLLATSRETLNISGEAVFRVPSLSVPDIRHSQSSETVTQFEAVQLFIDRAQTALPIFEVTHANASAVAQVCYRLDGIPLAIELAAARVSMLRVEQIESRLDDRFRLLTGGSRTTLPRHQTLRALIDWSYDLLSEPEHTLLQRLSVFAGGWTLEAAEVVCADDRIDSKDVLDLMSQLVNKSLVGVRHIEGADTRYQLLETIQQYVAEKLVEAGERDTIRDRHLDYFMALAERAEPELSAPHQVAWLNRLASELENIHVALEWSLERNVEAGLRLASALGANSLASFWMAQGFFSDGNLWLTQLLARPEAATRTAVRAKALNAQSRLAQWHGDSSRSLALAEESRALYSELEDRHGLAVSLSILGMAANAQGDSALARSAGAQSLALYREMGDKVGLADILDRLGHGIDNQDYVRARAYLEESLAFHREIGHVHGIFHVLQALGELALSQGDYALARPWFEEGLTISRTLGKVNTAQCLEGIGELALRQGDYEQARAYYEELLPLTTEMGRGSWMVAFLGYVHLRQGDPTSARVRFEESLWRFKQEGRKIGVVYTLEGLASLAVMQDQPERAVRLFGWAEAMREAIDNRRPPVEQADVDRDIASIHAQLDEATFVETWIAGRTLSMEKAIEFALEKPTP